MCSLSSEDSIVCVDWIGLLLPKEVWKPKETISRFWHGNYMELGGCIYSKAESYDRESSIRVVVI